MYSLLLSLVMYKTCSLVKHQLRVPTAGASLLSDNDIDSPGHVLLV